MPHLIKLLHAFLFCWSEMHKTESQFSPHNLKDVKRRLIGFLRQLMLDCFVEKICCSHSKKQMNVCNKRFHPTLKKETRKEYVFRHPFAALFSDPNFSQPRKAEGACSARCWNERARLCCNLADAPWDMFVGVCFNAKNAFLAEE